VSFFRRSGQAGEGGLADLAPPEGYSLEATITVGRSIAAVAFDEFIFEPLALIGNRSMLERGTSNSGTILAVGSVPWPQMPIEWIALQPRGAPNHLAVDEEMEPVGHREFDEAFVIDADDASLFRRRFRTSLRNWMVDFNADYGPLTIIFDGQPAEHAGSDEHPSAIFVAREVDNNDALLETLEIARILASHVRSGIHT
jgi:hypothetical protein